MSTPRHKNESFRHVGLGIEFAATLVGGCLAGVWVDRHHATAPWGVVIGATIGFAGGFYKFLRSSLRALRAAQDSAPSGKRNENT